MKRLLSSAALAFIFLGGSALPAAETKPSPSPEAESAKSALAGEYAGKWKSNESAGGALRLKLKQAGDATWSAEAIFTFEGVEVPTKTKSIKVEGSKLELVISWEIQGTVAQSKLNGEWNGDVLAGKYESSATEGAAHGTWNVSRL